MLKLKVLDIEEYNYVLENNNKRYRINLNFLGDKIPRINDLIYVDEFLIEEVNLYTYGPLNGKYAKKENVDYHEIMKVVSSNEEYYLQRYYG